MGMQETLEYISGLKLSPDFKLGDFVVSPINCEVRHSGDIFKLQNKEMTVLMMLVDKHPNIVTRADLIETIWNGNYVVGNNSLTRAIHSVRKIINKKDGPEIIMTVTGLGYLMTCPRTKLDEPEKDNEFSLSQQRHIDGQ